MKKLLLLGLCLFPCCLFAQQLTVSGAVEFSSHSYLSENFYAIKDVAGSGPSGESLIFIPANGNGIWEFEWTYEGSPQVVGILADSSRLVVSIPGNGYYTFKAVNTVSGDLVEAMCRVFYVHFSYSISLEDEMDCEYVRVLINDLDAPLYDGTYPGDKNPLYTIYWGTNSPRTLDDIPDYYREFSQYVAGISRNADVEIDIRDKFGLTWRSNRITWHSYIPKADFSVDPLNGEAPLEVAFSSNSENADYFEWYLYKDTNEITAFAPTLSDSLLQPVFYGENLPPYLYEHPGAYQVKLVVVNTQGINRCSDTLLLKEGSWIVVDSSGLEVPNVFTPNGDGINDLFKMKKEVSLRSFHGIILNRWGRKVYEWRDPNGGWDGRIGGKYASPGTYYYIITATGWELDARKYMKKGALLLVR